MKFSNQKWRLAVLWWIGFFVTFLEWVSLHWMARIGPDIEAKFRDLILEQFSPILLAISVSYLAADRSGKKSPKTGDAPFFIALAISVLWILVGAGFVFSACWNPERSQEALTSIKAILPKLSPLAAAATTFYFGKEVKAG